MNTAVKYDTDNLTDTMRLLEGIIADIRAAGPGSGGEFQAEAIMADIRKRADALAAAMDDAHAELCRIGRVFGV